MAVKNAAGVVAAETVNDPRDNAELPSSISNTTPTFIPSNSPAERAEAIRALGKQTIANVIDGEEVLDRAKGGEKITHAEVKDTIAKAQPTPSRESAAAPTDVRGADSALIGS
jgi:hypothetical protein